jgi:hypothetical protein
VNRLVESLQIFQALAASEYFEETEFFLLMNKEDIFNQKITKAPLSVCPAFNDFKDGNNRDLSLKCIQKKFEECMPKNKTLHTFVTVATDIHCIHLTFDSIKRILQKEKNMHKNVLQVLPSSV